MGNLASIVLCQSRTQIVGNTNIEMLRIVTFEDVDVFQGAAPLRQRGYNVGRSLR